MLITQEYKFPRGIILKWQIATSNLYVEIKIGCLWGAIFEKFFSSKWHWRKIFIFPTRIHDDGIWPCRMNDAVETSMVTNGARNLRGAMVKRQFADHLSEILPSRTCGVADREKINEIRNEIAIITSRLCRKYREHNDTFFEEYSNTKASSPK